MIAAELHRPVALERADGAEIVVEATPDECAAVAERLRLPGIASLVCRFRLRARPLGTVEARLALRARVTQLCAVTMEPFESEIAEACGVRFVPEGRETPDDAALGAPDLEDDDEIPYRGNALDLGEATVQQLALALPLHPRKPEAEIPEAARDARPNPFAALASRGSKPPTLH